MDNEGLHPEPLLNNLSNAFKKAGVVHEKILDAETRAQNEAVQKRSKRRHKNNGGKHRHHTHKEAQMENPQTQQNGQPQTVSHPNVNITPRGMLTPGQVAAGVGLLTLSVGLISFVGAFMGRLGDAAGGGTVRAITGSKK